MACLLLLLFVAANMLLAAAAKDLFLQQTKSRAYQVADNAALALEANLRRSNFLRVASSLASSDDINFVLIVDAENGQIVASSSYKYRRSLDELPGEVQPMILAALQDGQPLFSELESGDYWFSYTIRTIPNRSSEVKKYLMLIDFSGEHIQNTLSRISISLAIYVGLGASLFALIGYWLMRYFVLRPVQKMAVSIQDKNQGKPFKPPKLHMHDELHTLNDALTEMHQVERDSLALMQEAKSKAEATSKAKSAFLANMSHEIRTPINGVLGLAQVALRSKNQEEIKQYLEKIYLSGKTLIGVVNDILDFSKLNAGKLNIEKTPFCPDQLVEQVVELCQHTALKKQIDIRVELSQKLPLVIVSDPLRIQQVLLNLTNNAVKFTEQGEVTICMHVSQDSEGAQLHFSVTDTGIGIEQDKLESLFEEFVQEDGSTTRKFGGTGLGLSICSKITETMGGKIQAASVKGEGSTFSVSLPVEVAANHQLQVKLREVLMASRLVCDYELPNTYSGPFVELVNRMKSFSKGADTIKLMTLSQFLDASESNQLARSQKLVVLGAEQSLMQHIELNENVYPLFSMLNRESLIDLLHRVSQDKSQPQGTIESRLSDIKDKKLLLVEDNIINAEVVIAMLSDFDFELKHVENGQQAVEIIPKYEPDLVLMDVQMPVMDGYQATEFIRQELKSAVAIVGLSANVLPEEVERAKSLGMNDYLSKPVLRDALLHKILFWFENTASKSGA